MNKKIIIVVVLLMYPVFCQAELKIAVCAKQYSFTSDFAGRGFGDVAHGVRAVEWFKMEYPDSRITFVVEVSEHADAREHEIIKKMVNIPNVDSIIITEKDDGFYGSVESLLDQADFIFHAPSGLVGPIAKSPEKHIRKILATSEYDTETGLYAEKTGIVEHQLGFRSNKLYLKNRQSIVNTFKNLELSNNLLFGVPKHPDRETDPVYLAYGSRDGFQIGFLKFVLLAECGKNRDVNIISSEAYEANFFDPKTVTEIDRLLTTWCPGKLYNLVYRDEENKPASILLPSSFAAMFP